MLLAVTYTPSDFHSDSLFYKAPKVQIIYLEMQNNFVDLESDCFGANGPLFCGRAIQAWVFNQFQ